MKQTWHDKQNKTDATIHRRLDYIRGLLTKFLASDDSEYMDTTDLPVLQRIDGELNAVVEKYKR